MYTSYLQTSNNNSGCLYFALDLRRVMKFTHRSLKLFIRLMFSSLLHMAFELKRMAHLKYLTILMLLLLFIHMSLHQRDGYYPFSCILSSPFILLQFPKCVKVYGSFILNYAQLKDSFTLNSNLYLLNSWTRLCSSRKGHCDTRDMHGNFCH